MRERLLILRLKRPNELIAGFWMDKFPSNFFFDFYHLHATCEITKFDSTPKFFNTKTTIVR